MRYEDLQRIEIDGWKYVVFEEQCSVGILDGVVADGQKTLVLGYTVGPDGEHLLVESVEMGAFYSVDSIEELVVPDCYTYIDNDAFHNCRNLKKIIIGKGLECYRYWSFAGCPIEEIVISLDNPFIKVSEDGAMILSKNGDLLCSVIKDIPSITIPEKVIEIDDCAISCLQNLKTITFPSSLQKISWNAIFELSALEELVIPERVCEIGLQAISYNPNLKLLDLPSTLKKLGYEAIDGNVNLHTLILRSSDVVAVDKPFYKLPVDTCHLMVPPRLIQKYKNHPHWGKFKQIIPINDER